MSCGIHDSDGGFVSEAEPTQEREVGILIERDEDDLSSIYRAAEFLLGTASPSGEDPIPDEPSLTLQTVSFFPIPISNSEWSYHPDEHILSMQTLSPRPVLQQLFKEEKTACGHRFHPYIPTPQPRQKCRHPYPLVVPVRASVKFEEDLHDGSSITPSNPFAPTERAVRSTNHFVSGSLESIPHDQSSRPHAIPLEYLKKITDNFSDEQILGQGGSGVVYKGVPKNGKIIAVKKIVSSLMPGLQKQFENEVSHLMELKHPNIVRCVGYCYEVKKECLQYNGKYVFAEMAERLLCLEYMPNGSLNKYISDESSGLHWSTRYRIIEGICYGLCHLHEQNVVTWHQNFCKEVQLHQSQTYSV